MGLKTFALVMAQGKAHVYEWALFDASQFWIVFKKPSAKSTFPTVVCAAREYVFVSVSLCLCLPVSLCLSVSLPCLSPSLYLSFCVHMYVYIYLPRSLSLSLSGPGRSEPSRGNCMTEF